MKILKAGIIGCRSEEKVYACKKLIPGCLLEAVCDIDEKILKEISSKYGVTGFTDYRKMIDATGIDIVVISTPDDMHLEQAVYAIERGKHVYCEKPSAVNLADAVKFMKAAANSENAVQIGYELRISELYKRAKDAVCEGWCGQILFAFHDYLRPPWNEPEHFKMKKNRCGGVIVHEGCHYLDFLRWMVGSDVMEINCYAPPVKTRYYDGILDNFRLNMRHKNGAVSGMTWSHMFGGRQIMNFCFIGTEGAIFCRRDRLGNGAENETRKIQFIKHKVDNNGKVYGQKLVREEDYSFRSWAELGHDITACMRDFVGRILEDRKPLIPLEKSFITEYLCFKAEESAVEGKPLAIPSYEKILALI